MKCTKFVTSDSSGNIKNLSVRLKEILVYKQTCQLSDGCISTTRLFTMCVPFLCCEWVSAVCATEHSVQGPHSQQVTQSQRAVQLTQSSFSLWGLSDSFHIRHWPISSKASLTINLRSISRTTMDWSTYSSWKTGSILVSKNLYDDRYRLGIVTQLRIISDPNSQNLRNYNTTLWCR
jgi:hypothetical protein